MHVSCPPTLPLPTPGQDLKKLIDVKELFNLLDNFDAYYRRELMFDRLTHSGGYASIHVSVYVIDKNMYNTTPLLLYLFLFSLQITTLTCCIEKEFLLCSCLNGKYVFM